MLSTLLSLVIFVEAVSAGTLCPPRENIYPCSCANIHQNKKTIHTVVNCHRLRDSDVLSSIFPALRSMQIDQFHLYDSFWEAQVESSKKSLPTDWMTLLKIKELEIVDTALSACFACQWKLTCRNSVTNRFTAVNSTTSESLCTLCDSGRGSKFPWTACMSRLKHFHFSHSKLTSFGADMFPIAMKELTLLNLTHNRIARVDQNALKNLQRLTLLDLSHNAIESIDFFKQTTNLELLDLSWNNLKTIGQVFKYMPLLKTFKIESNAIEELKEDEWKIAPKSLWYININDNPLHCDCNIRFVNSTFHVSATILGTCMSPPEYENSALRAASRMMNERCNEEGSIGTRKKLVTPAMPKIKKIIY